MNRIPRRSPRGCAQHEQHSRPNVEAYAPVEADDVKEGFAEAHHCNPSSPADLSSRAAIGDANINEPTRIYTDIWAGITFILGLLLFFSLPIATFLSFGAAPLWMYLNHQEPETFELQEFKSEKVGQTFQILSWLPTFSQLRCIPYAVAYVSLFSAFFALFVVRSIRRNSEAAVSWVFRIPAIAFLLAAVRISATPFYQTKNAEKTHVLTGIAASTTVSAIFFALPYFFAKKLKQTAALLQFATACVERHPSLYALVVVSAFFRVVTFIWSAFYLGSVLLIWLVADLNGNSFVISATTFGLLMTGWILRFLTVFQHTVTCGVVAGDIVNSFRSVPKPHGYAGWRAVARCSKRALTYSLGSVCVAPFLLMASEAMNIAYSFRRSNKNWRSMISTASAPNRFGLQSTFNIFYDYAMVYVILYNMSIFNAARQTFTLLRSNFFLAIVSGGVTGLFIMLSSLVCGFMGAFLVFCAQVYAGNFPNPLSSTKVSGEMSFQQAMIASLSVGFGFFTGFMVLLSFMSILKSATSAAVICFASDSDSVKRYDAKSINMVFTAFSFEDNSVHANISDKSDSQKK